MIGMSAMIKSGVDAQMSSRVDKTWNRHRSHDLNASGTDLSTASISFENLLMMRPVGVDSKNCIVLFKMDTNMRSCMVLIEAKNMQRYKKPAPNVMMPVKKKKKKLSRDYYFQPDCRR